MRRVVALLALVGACRSVPPPPPETPEQRAARISRWETGIRSFLLDESVRLQPCYTDELARIETKAIAGDYRMAQEKVPGLAGKFVLVLPVELDGAVREPRIEEDSLLNAQVTNCVLARAKQYRFDGNPTGEVVDLELPLRFELTAVRPPTR